MTIALWPSYQNLVILIGRFLAGVGSSGFALLRSYAATASTKKDQAKVIAMINGAIALGYAVGPATASTKKDQAKVIAMINGAIALGYAVGPEAHNLENVLALQVIFTPIGYPGIQIYDKFYLNLYTTPAIVAVIIDLICFPLIGIFFKEHYAGLEDSSSTVNSISSTENVLKVKPPKPDMVASWLCYATRFTQMFIDQNLELINSLFATTMFAYTKAQVVQATALAQALFNGLSFISYMSFIGINFSKYVNHRILTIAMLGVFISFHLITFPWPFLPGNIQVYNNIDSQNATTELVGCNIDQLSWCSHIAPVNPWLYFGCFVVLIGIAFSNLTVSLSTLFAEILGPRRQGTQQGFLQVSGGLGKMIGPLMASYIFTHYGPRVVWYMEILLVSMTILLLSVFYKRMVPLQKKIYPNA
uniref:Major facilitator superfamily (MFS) profile domain-containing protein n=1 Tax=Acrobeloides nanus TaxID=290746 RepID=A0A914C844_9BILA